MKPILKILLFIILSKFCLAQKEISNWHFANNNTLQFQNNNLINGTPNLLLNDIGNTSISDSAGNLLFYTNGVQVFNRNNVLMNGFQPANVGVSPNMIAVRKPGSQSVYYILFAERQFGASFCKLQYHEVDMSLNGGLGGLTAINVLLRDSVSYSFNAVRKPGSDDFWLITHKPFSKQYRADLVTSASFSAQSILNVVGQHYDASDYLLYDIKPSHDGKRIAVASRIRNSTIFGTHTDFVEVYDFDANTGAMTYYVKTGSHTYAYFASILQLEFSPDNKLLYLLSTTEVGGLQPCDAYYSYITQYNLCYTDSNDFEYSVGSVGYYFNCSHSTLGRLQMGPDKKIYFPQSRSSVLGRIEYPNRIGSSCTPKFNVHSVSPNVTTHGVPSFYHYYVEKAIKNNIDYDGGCFPAPQRFRITNDTILNVLWDFGDSGSGGNNTSSLVAPIHSFSSPGFYNVTAKLYNSSGVFIETVSELVEIKDPGKRLLDGYPTDTSFCYGSSYKLKLKVVNGIFRWYRKLDTLTYLTAVNDSLVIYDSGRYYVEMHQNDCDGCIMRDSIDVNVLPTPYVDLGFDRSFCTGDSVVLKLFNPGASYLWNTGDTTSFLVVKSGGNYSVRAEFNGNGCPKSDSINITQFPGIVFNLPSDTTLCNNYAMILRPGITNAYYEWQNGSSADTFVVSQPGTYWVRIRSQNGCSKSDTIQVSYVNAASVYLGRDTSLCEGDSLVLQSNIQNATFLWNTQATSSSIIVRNSGDYWLRVNNGSCTVTDTIHVQFNAKPVFTLGSDSVLCEASKLALRTGLSNALHLWQDGSSLDSFLVSQPGIYWVNATINSCSIRDSITINYKPSPVVNLGNDTTICSNATLILNAQHPSIQFYRWQDNSAQSSFLITNPGLYYLRALGTNGCSKTDSIVVTSVALPSFTLGNDSILCETTSLTLSVNLQNAIYRWSNGSNQKTFVVSKPGLYWVDVTQNNCTRRDSISIAYKPQPVVNLGDDTTLCEGQVRLLNAFNVGATYSWQDKSTSSTYNVQLPGKYNVAVNLNGCIVHDTTFVEYNYKPKFTLGRDTVLCSGQQLLLDPRITNSTFLWQDGSTNGIFSVNQPGTYSLTVSNNCGSTSDQIVVVRGVCMLLMPNAFTPDNNGSNDLFRIKFPEYIKTFKMLIFNRWGEVVFESNDPRRGWDGKFKGLLQPEGAYAWSISLTDLNGNTENGKGVVVLIR